MRRSGPSLACPLSPAQVIAATTKLSQSRPVYEAVAALEKVGENVPSPLGTFPP